MQNALLHKLAHPVHIPIVKTKIYQKQRYETYSDPKHIPKKAPDYHARNLNRHEKR
jgi:hypothetical protein